MCIRDRAGDIEEWKKEEIAQLVETLAVGSVRKSTQKKFLAKWNTWVKEREVHGKGPWLYAPDDPDKR